VRILLGKLGEGHKQALLNLAKSLSEAGFEVIYSELQEPAAIVKSALQESVDHIGITVLPGGEVQALEKILLLLKEEEAGHIRVTAGGTLDDEDLARVMEMGVMAVFPKGTIFAELVEWSRHNIMIEHT
jgi:methylmalonyl-CoA mutase C-terminal domain/subunit